MSNVSQTNRSYTVYPEGKCYQGFDRDYNPIELEHVVLVTVDGELDVYAVDDPNNVSDLVAYLSDRESGVVKIIGAYSR